MIKGPVLVDAGPLVALFRGSQEHDEICRLMLHELRPPLLTCWPVITEAAYLLRGRPNEVRALLESFPGGFLQLVPLDASDILGIQAILDQYQDQGFQLADACLMYLAEREKVDCVFTLDRRDFSVFRTARGAALTVLP